MRELSDNSESFREFYTTHSDYTDPGEYRYLFDGIIAEAVDIVNAVQNVMLSVDQVESEGIQIPERLLEHELNMNTVRKMLRSIADKDNQPLVCPRQVGVFHYAQVSVFYVKCRD